MTTEHDEFWGDEAGWSTSPTRDHTTEHPLVSDATPARGVGRKASRLWGSLLSNRSTATRAHGSNFDNANDQEVETETELTNDNDPTEVSEQWDDGWDVEPAPVPNGRVDPLLAKFGGAAVVLTLLIPVAIGLRSGSDEQLIEAAAAASSATLAADTNSLESAATTPPTVVATSGAQAPASSANADTSAPSTEAEATSISTAGDHTRPASELSSDAQPTDSASGNIAVAAEADAQAERVEPECPIEYEVVVGDFWIRIADGAGVSVSELLALNGASSGTPVYPGSSICLPAGSSTPPPPSPSVTTPVATSPATTAAPTTAAPTTAPPTTAPPTTAAPAPTAPADIEEIIRYVWPDELEEHALEVAWRESNYVPTAKNYCCYGLFQMYWEMHRSWLGDIGVTSATQLYDPATNARAAYALYQRAGGWGPWGG
jgi:LysM repeat protein